jgi:hypothetical protein
MSVTLSNIGISLSSGSAPSTLLDGLMGYWKLDETSGNAVDSSGNGYTGTSSNITYTASGKIGRCFTFNGTSTYVEFGDVCQPTDGLTISCWVKVGSIPDSTVVIDNRGYDSKYFGYTITIYSANAWGYIIGDADQTADVYVSAANIHSDTWQHLVVTWSGGTTVHYTNGVQGSGQSVSGPLSYNTGGYHEGLRFGIGLWDSDYYPGDLDEVGIWSRALTNAEVSWLYNSNSGLTHPFS